MGRHSIFRGKEGGYRVQAIITKQGGQRFEKARKALASLYSEVMGTRPATVSDADVVEYMARGVDGTREYLEKSRRQK